MIRRYMAPIEVVHTAATAVPSTVWNLKGAPNVTIRPLRLRLTMGLCGVAPSPGVVLRYGLYRGTSRVASGASGTPSGGTQIAPTPVDSDIASGASDCRYDLTGAGLTTSSTGIIYDATPLHVICLATTSAHVAAPADGGASLMRDVSVEFEGGGPAIRADQHLAIRLQTQTSIVGQTLCGSIEWTEE